MCVHHNVFLAAEPEMAPLPSPSRVAGSWLIPKPVVGLILHGFRLLRLRRIRTDHDQHRAGLSFRFQLIQCISTARN